MPKYAYAFLFVVALTVPTLVASQNVGNRAPASENTSSAPQSAEKEPLAGACRGFDFSGKVTDGYFVQHGGGKIKVRIPVDYLLFPETGSSFAVRDDGAANFNFHRDTLRPYPRREMEGKIVAGKQEWISFLVTDLIEIKSIAKISANILSGRKSGSTESPFPEELVSQDLFHVRFPSRSQPAWQQKTLYLGRSNSIITDVISCNVRQPRRYPNCEQITRLAGYDVKIFYPLDQLEKWKLTKRNVQNLLECMTE
ncbi:hypothetical protein [Rhizobium leguminosarum]|uniref:hypothetical protein n=1 Tax=Rhizobium leguminosarum TaxID=384 RepID=UPI001C970EED|nr:hypothetical protein [Rhizobium leguminosarum]MBY5827720.1 hypothetical protein [Rhizobium leguminosarum]